jgi:O-antigen ligase
MVLLIVPTFNDSNNIPKYSVLFFAAAFGASVLSIPKFGLLEKKNWKTWAPPLSFLIIMFVMACTSDQRYTAFFGNYGRNNGWFQYLGLTTLFLLTAFSFNLNTLTKFNHLLAILGSTISFYGYFQSRGIDFINFAETSFPVITTLGNANFASTFMGLASIALLWEIFYLKKIHLRLMSLFVLIGTVYVIYVSESSQGLFVLLIGGLVFIGIKFFSSSKKIGMIYFSVFGFVSFLGLLGLFQIGPLTRFVYQPSTTFRGDYYRAAWRMFESRPITGVGIDNFGGHYRTFRDVDAALRLDPNTVANYAHNIFLQQLATGGIFLFLAYSLFILVVARAAIKGLKTFEGENKSKFGALVSLWVGYQVQSQVSIDQITIAAIGWVLAGAVVALGFNSEIINAQVSHPNRNMRRRSGVAADTTLIASGLTLVLVVSSFALLVPIWQAEHKIKIARSLTGNTEKLLAIRELLLTDSINLVPREVNYKIIASRILANQGDLPESKRLLFLALEDDPRSFTAHDYLAQIYEKSGDIKSAILIRNKISLLDPFNTNNWLLLGKDLAEIRDYQTLQRTIERIAPLAYKSTIVDDLKAFLPIEIS